MNLNLIHQILFQNLTLNTTDVFFYLCLISLADIQDHFFKKIQNTVWWQFQQEALLLRINNEK